MAPPARLLSPSRFSLLRAGIAVRLAAALAASCLLWAVILWAMA